MKIFQNKKVWQKIVIILLIILLFKFVINIPTVHAAADDGVLLEPITSLFANLGDGIMGIAQKTFLGSDSSGAWVEDGGSFWAKIATIIIGIVIATLAVVAIALSQGTALVLVATAVGAVLKIGAATAIAYFAVSTIHFGSSGFYLPEYELTLGSILKNEVLAFDVNFFNPKDPKEKNIYVTKNIEVGEDVTDFKGNKAKKMNQTEYNQFISKYNVGNPLSNYSYTGPYQEGDYSFYVKVNAIMGTGANDIAIRMRKYEWKVGDINYSAYFGYYSGYGATKGEYYVARFKTTDEAMKDYDYSPAYILKPTIASWYLAIRNIALVALLSILVYIGIRITLTSVAGDKAKYKQMLVDWVIALALVFLMHYIMSFAVSINELIIKGIDSITLSSYGNEQSVIGNGEKKVGNLNTDKFYTQNANYTEPKNRVDDVNSIPAAKEFKAAGVQMFILDDKDKVEKAYKVLVGDGSQDNSGSDSPFYNRFNKDHTVMVWPANDFTVQARILAQDIGDDENQTKVARAGYNIIYVMLVIYTIIFCFTYLRRVIYMAFLTLIAPLVAITYPIDKISDGKAQAFDMWFKEYVFNLLMQPLHLLLYTILVGMAMKFAANYIFYSVVAIGFLVPAEKILRRFFRFERAQTPGMFEGAAGAALLMSGFNKLMHRPQKRSKLGSGDGSGKDEENSKISTYKNGEDPFGNLGNDKDKDRDKDSSVRTVSKSDDTDNDNKDNDKNNEYTVENAGTTEKYDFSGGTTTSSTSSNSPEISKNASTNRDALKNNNDETNNKKRKIHPGRMIRRGLIAHGKGMQKRYKANKKIKGGLVRRALRTTAGVATAGTMAAAGGIIGIATGDMGKAAKFMGAGAIGGYRLGQSGVDITADKLKEQFGEPLKEAKIGYYGEKEYQERESEKWKKQEFENNAENIMKLEERFDLNHKEAQELSSKELEKYTKTKGIDSFDKTAAVYASSTKGGGTLSTQEALLAGHISETKINGKGADSLGRNEREELTKDIIDRIKENYKKNKVNISDQEATDKAIKIINGTNEYAKNLK